MSETEPQYEQLAEQYQELADTLNGIVERLDFIAEHEQTDELQAERAKHMKLAVMDIQRGENWSHHSHNLSQEAYYKKE